MPIVRFTPIAAVSAAALMAALMAATPAQALDVTFTGNLANVCVLAVTTPGVLAVATDGKSISSEVSGGTAAVMTVVAVGLNPSLTFGAPALTAPAGWSGAPATSIRYTSVGGITHAYTATSSTVSAPGLLDTYTLNSKVDSATGFAGGSYVVRTTVTCQQ